MQSEAIIEKGIVLNSSEGLAEIALIETGSCEECSAKIFCKPSETKDSKIIEVNDPFGVVPGDEVQIEIAGSDVLKASAMLYGVPLVLIILGIVAGMEMFSAAQTPELFSFLFSAGLAGAYLGGLVLFSKTKLNKPKLPQITFVKRP